MLLKSIKMLTWTSRRLFGDPLDPWINKIVTQDRQNTALDVSWTYILRSRLNKTLTFVEIMHFI